MMAKKRREITWGESVVRFQKEYQRGLENRYVRKPLAFAAYHLWRWLDAHENKRTVEGFEDED